MNKFYIARHGETLNNRAKRLSGWIDTPLTDDGLVPTQVVIAKLQGVPIDEIYSSDSGRAFVTAYTIARGLDFEQEIVRLSGLREVNYGDAANMRTVDAYKKYPRIDRDTHFVAPNGESLDYMQKRVIETVVDLDKKHTNSIILLVAHSGVMAALRSGHIGQDFGEHNISEAYPHDYVATFTVKDGQIASFQEVAK